MLPKTVITRLKQVFKKNISQKIGINLGNQ